MYIAYRINNTIFSKNENHKLPQYWKISKIKKIVERAKIDTPAHKYMTVNFHGLVQAHQ